MPDSRRCRHHRCGVFCWCWLAWREWWRSADAVAANAPDMARMAFALMITMCLAPVWPAGPAAIPGMFTFALWMIAEAALGVLIGLFVSVLVESFQLAAQVLGLQAGFSYASTVDPGSQADSTVLQSVCATSGGDAVLRVGAGPVADPAAGAEPGDNAPGDVRGRTADRGTGDQFTGTMFRTASESRCRWWRCCCWWMWRWRWWGGCRRNCSY
jgi:hypothetical protein